MLDSAQIDFKTIFRRTDLAAHVWSSILRWTKTRIRKIGRTTLLATDTNVAPTPLIDERSVIRWRIDNRGTTRVPLPNCNYQIRGLRLHHEVEPAPLRHCFLYVILGSSICCRIGQRFPRIGMNHNADSLSFQYVVWWQLLFLFCISVGD